MLMCETPHCQKLGGHSGEHAKWDAGTQSWVPVFFPTAKQIPQYAPTVEEARDSAATHDLLLVQHMLGHSSPATTRRYIEYGRSEMRSVVERLSTEGIAA